MSVSKARREKYSQPATHNNFRKSVKKPKDKPRGAHLILPTIDDRQALIGLREWLEQLPAPVTAKEKRYRKALAHFLGVKLDE